VYGSLLIRSLQDSQSTGQLTKTILAIQKEW
jgi:hypothetical protein